MINRQNRAVTTRSIVSVKGKASVGEPGIEKTQTANADDEQFLEDEFLDLPHCSCGALMRTTEELGGVCSVTGQLICLACSKVKCARCHKSVSVEARINLFGDVYCRRCAIKLVLVWLLVSLGILVSVFFLVFK